MSGKHRHYTEDGREWHEARSGREIADLPDEARVIVGSNGEVHEKRDFATWSLAGSPFLVAIAHLMPAYIEGGEPGDAADPR